MLSQLLMLNAGVNCRHMPPAKTKRTCGLPCCNLNLDGVTLPGAVFKASSKKKGIEMVKAVVDRCCTDNQKLLC